MSECVVRIDVLTEDAETFDLSDRLRACSHLDCSPTRARSIGRGVRPLPASAPLFAETVILAPDPLPVKAVGPERALLIGGGMFGPTVPAFGTVGARFASSSGGDGLRLRIGVAFAAAGHGPMVHLHVHLIISHTASGCPLNWKMLIMDVRR